MGARSQRVSRPVWDLRWDGPCSPTRSIRTAFRDKDGEGIGDLRGNIQKLDYLQELGVDVV